MPQMIISFNYLIAAVAFFSSFLLSKKGRLYTNATRFMFFLGFAAFVGGLVHHIELEYGTLTQILNKVNLVLPRFLDPLQLDMINNRLWFIAIECIGFAEFYFMFLFIDPVIHGRFEFIKTYLKCALALYVIITIISTQYFFVVAFHVISHIVIISFSLFMYFRYKVTSFLLLVFLALYNLIIGIIQQLMNYQVIPSGPLHYNDWYHIGAILFIVFLHIILTKGKLIENLNSLNTNS